VRGVSAWCHASIARVAPHCNTTHRRANRAERGARLPVGLLSILKLNTRTTLGGPSTVTRQGVVPPAQSCPSMGKHGFKHGPTTGTRQRARHPWERPDWADHVLGLSAVPTTSATAKHPLQSKTASKSKVKGVLHYFALYCIQGSYVQIRHGCVPAKS